MTEPRLLGDEAALLNDLYQFTMAASFFAHGFNDRACFSLTVRHLPPRRGYLVVAGVESFLQIVEKFCVAPPALEYLDSLKIFAPQFLDYLSKLRFTGDVWAMPEGTLFFAEEPIVEIRAPLIEAQLLETSALNQIGSASLIAAKAARIFSAAEGRRLIDMGLRRSHGVDGGLIAARSSYIAGFHGTSNLLAGKRYGIPVFGTMAHSYVMAHDRERDAFAHFAENFPTMTTLLVDTYDAVRGIESAAQLAQELKQSGINIQGIRLDSGDLLDLSRRARRILDRHDLKGTAIFASGSLDEYSIHDLVRAGAPIDAFGVGTAMVVSADAPALDANYKLAEYKGTARLKTSSGKPSLPGAKQVFRAWNAPGGFYADLVGLAEEAPAQLAREFKPAPAKVTPLLVQMMRAGTWLVPLERIADARERFLDAFSKLEPRYKHLERPETYPLKTSAALNALLISEKLRIESRQR